MKTLAGRSARSLMSITRRRWLAAGGAALLALGIFTGCQRADPDQLPGYLEGEFVYVAAPVGGRLEQLAVERGAEVRAGDELFTLETEPEQSSREEVARRLRQALATLDDLKLGARPTELEALRASLREAEAARALAEKELTRQTQLEQAGGVASAQAVDQARAARDQSRERVAQLAAQIETAHLGARADQVAAAEAAAAALEATLSQADWLLAQKTQTTARAGRVFDTLYREGEWVPAGRPVVMLLPPAGVKLRVYVPQARVGALRVGDAVEVLVDGLGSVASRISYVSTRAEFTPPVLYNRENRDKLVYLVEAQFDPADAVRLHPGQPVDVRFGASAPR